MDNILSSTCTEMKQFLETLFSSTECEINLIIEEGSKEIELYLNAAAEKFHKKRGRKQKKTEDVECKSSILNQTENKPEFKRPTRIASKIASQKLKDDITMPLTKKLRRVENSEGSFVVHSDRSVLLNANIKQERISEELVNQDELCTSEMENPNSTCYLMQAIDEIVQSTPAPLPSVDIPSFKDGIEQKPIVLNGTVVQMPKESIQQDLELNVTYHTDSSDKEPKSVKKSKRIEEKNKKTVNQSSGSSSSSGLSNFGSPQPMRVTRTKTRAMANSAALSSDQESCKENISSAKKCNNALSKQMLNNGNQSSKVGMIVSHLESFITKQKPALIPLATKQLEDAQMREEKAAEVERKREKLLKEKAENQKRINEAKQLKVQQAREQMEFQKKEKLRQCQMKKAEALKKQRELEHADLKEKIRLQENQKKQQALIKSTAEQDVRNEQSKLDKMNPQAVILKTQTNLNITYDASGCVTAESSMDSKIFGINDIYSGESSEEDEERLSKKIFPAWTLPENRRKALAIQSRVPFELVKEFIVCGAQTPDLTKIFEKVPKKALTRTSSAIWNTPPLKKF